MESANSSSDDSQESCSADTSTTNDPGFSERFESLLPRIQERWPDVAKQTLEATRGSLDELVRVISEQSSGSSKYGVRQQIEELFEVAGERTRDLADNLEPLEKQLEDLLDELNSTLRPRIEGPVRNRPLLAVGIAAGVGLLIGLIMGGGRKS